MNHNLTIGHMDTTLVAERGSKILRPLDDRIVRQHLQALGSYDGDRWALDGGPVEIRNGCLVVQWWVGAFRNRISEEFALRMIRDTGCQIIDREHGRVIGAGELEGLAAGQVAVERI
jgi:hypothetical protein